MRWDKLLAVVNRSIEPTEEDLDPTRVELDLDEMKKAYRLKYHDIKVLIHTSIYSLTHCLITYFITHRHLRLLVSV